MGKPILFEVMDDFSIILNSESIENSAQKLIARAALESNALAIDALARLLAIENARRKAAEAKLNSFLKEE